MERTSILDGTYDFWMVDDNVGGELDANYAIVILTMDDSATEH